MWGEINEKYVRGGGENVKIVNLGIIIYLMK